MSFSRPKQTPVYTITAPIRFALTDPRLTAPLFIAALYFPEKLQSIIPIQLRSWITAPMVVRALSVFLGVGIVRKLNGKLSQLTANNWKADAKFVKSQELVLISGGTSGIGQLMARQFAEKGVKVVILDINAPKNSLPSNVFFYEADVTNSAAIASAAADIRRDHGEPTVLINNAGIGTGETILGGREEMIKKVFEVNTISHFWMVREFLPAMIKKNHGHVVTIASMASYVVLAQNVDYSCSKASALAFHEGLSSELRARYNAPNVRTTVVNPSWIRTPLIEPLIALPEFKDPVLEMDEVTTAVVKQVLSGRSGQLILPEQLNLLTTIRAWPAWMQYATRNRVANVMEGPALMKG